MPATALKGALPAALLAIGAIAFASAASALPLASVPSAVPVAAPALSPAFVLSAVPASIAAAPTPTAAPAVYVENQAQPTRLPIKPHGYYSNTSIHNLSWSNWGQATATARGTFTFQFCVEESCSVSPFYDEPVLVTLSNIQRCRSRLSYTTLALDVQATLPDSSFKGYRTSVAACAKSRSHARPKHG
jgi:hypothetical protein